MATVHVPRKVLRCDNTESIASSREWIRTTSLPQAASARVYNGAVGLTPDIDCLANPACAATIAGSGLDGHVDPRQVMDVGVMNGNIPAPMMAFDADDEFFS